ncbi:MAG: hypothetical protein WB586_18540 [Chthoniobacterales bacterium]
MKATNLVLAAILGLGAFVSVKADEIQFTTLPEVVKTTVVRQTNIPDYSRVTRVIRDTNGVYEVTVRRDSGDDVLYVDDEGRLVREHTVAVAPGQRVIQQTVTETTEPTVDTFIRSLDSARYQLIEKKGEREVYRDKQTGIKWVVKVEQEND